MIFAPNDSPLAGRDGTHLTGSKIGERLAAEAATSVSLRVQPVAGKGEAFEVQAPRRAAAGVAHRYANTLWNCASSVSRVA